MQNEKTIIALGHDESVYIFSAIGIKSIIVNNKNIKEIVNENIKNGTKIFFVSQAFSNIINELKEEYSHSAYPIFLQLAMDKDTNSDGVSQIKKNVEKATGISLI